MMENDPLRSMLREWQAPEPPAELESRLRTKFRARHQRSPWAAFWRLRISIPAPALAVFGLVLLALFLQFRTAPAPVSPRAGGGYVTRLDATGFQPLPNGAARVVSARGIEQ
jgi:hypothetical protein